MCSIDYAVWFYTLQLIFYDLLFHLQVLLNIEIDLICSREGAFFNLISLLHTLLINFQFLISDKNKKMIIDVIL